jgi:hypothetical protein
MSILNNFLRFAAGIENIFNFMFLIEIISCTIQICLQIFVLVTVSVLYEYKSCI